MKTLKTLVLTFLLALMASLLAPTQARADVNFSFFYDSLSPYGDWVQVDDYGYCWRPSDRDADWRPYSDGYWAQTDAGWTWVSYEDYGSVVYHYGRWVDLDEEGWVWVPGNEWGPGWVSWRSNDDYVGWAPLPPRAHFSVTVGIGFNVDRDYDIGPANYNFCEVRNFGAPDLRPVIVNRQRNVTIINQTTNITNITVNNTKNVVYNGGPDVNVINRRSAKPIQRLNLVRDTNVQAGGGKNGLRSRKQGNDLLMPAPRIQRDESAKIAPQKVKRNLGRARVNDGWKGVPDAERQQVKKKFQADAVRTRPQREVSATDATPANVENPGIVPPVQKPAEGGKKHKGQAGNDRPNAPQKKGDLQPFLPADQNAVAAPAEKKGKGKQKADDNGDVAAQQARRQQREQKQQQEAAAQEQQRAARQAQRQQEAAAEQQQAQKRAERQQNQEQQLRRAQREQNAGAGQQDEQRAALRAQRQQQAAQAERQAERQQQAAQLQRQAERQQQQQQAVRQQRQLERAQAEQAAGGDGPGEGKKKKKKDKDDRD